MVENPFISVCMPVYNAELYLAEAIEGVLCQTYKNFELIICDNNSSDDSARIAREYAGRSPKIRFFQNNWNIEYSGNLQKVTSLAAGDFLIVHAADDVALPTALETFVETIRDTDLPLETLILASDFYVINQHGKRLSRTTLETGTVRVVEMALEDEELSRPRTQRLSGKEILLDRLPRLVSFGWPGSVLFSRQLFEAVEGYYNNHWYNPDKFFIYKILSLTPNVIWIREPLFYSRWHDTNQAAQQRSTKVLKYLLDEYAFTFELPAELLTAQGTSREGLIQTFVERDCIEAALREMAVGTRLQGFRHLCFGLAAYPQVAWKMSKTYLVWLIWILGPLSQPVAKLIYRNGIWRKWWR